MNRKYFTLAIALLISIFFQAQAQQTYENYVGEVVVHASVNFLSIEGAKIGTSDDGEDTYYQPKLSPPVGKAYIIASGSGERLFTWMAPAEQAAQVEAEVLQLIKTVAQQDSVTFFVESETDDDGNIVSMLYREGDFEGIPILSVRNDKVRNKQCYVTLYSIGPIGEDYLKQDYTKDLDKMTGYAANGLRDILGEKIGTDGTQTVYASTYQPKLGEISIFEDNATGSRYVLWKTPLALSPKLKTDTEAYIQDKYKGNPLYQVDMINSVEKGVKMTMVEMKGSPILDMSIIENSEDLSPSKNLFAIMIYQTK